jgi:hypothetical protein
VHAAGSRSAAAARIARYLFMRAKLGAWP